MQTRAFVDGKIRTKEPWPSKEILHAVGKVSFGSLCDKLRSTEAWWGVGSSCRLTAARDRAAEKFRENRTCKIIARQTTCESTVDDAERESGTSKKCAGNCPTFDQVAKTVPT